MVCDYADNAYGDNYYGNCVVLLLKEKLMQMLKWIFLKFIFLIEHVTGLSVLKMFWIR